MRTPPNLKYLISFLMFIGLIVAGTIYLPEYIPNLGEILGILLIAGMFILIVFAFIKPFIGLLYARADGIFEVFMDVSEKGIHIFSYHLNSDGEYGDSTRDIQHYFILIGTGKLYFKKLFSHSMEPADGRSGWGDFYSFEESVMGSKQLPVSIKKLSAKAKMELKLGRQIKSSGDDHYEIFQNEFLITIKKYSNAADEGIRVICTERQTEKQIWKRKI